MFLILVFALKILTADARVYCQDRNSFPWRPLGFSCPITCKNIISAVERLKQIDYQNLVNLQTVTPLSHLHKSVKLKNVRTKRTQRTHRPTPDPTEQKYKQTYKAFINILHTEPFFADFKLELASLATVLNITCYVAANRSRLLRHVLNDCTVNKTNGFILRNFMEFLNKYAHPDYGFDVGMALIVLKHLLSNSNFRYGMMEAILVYLKRALKPEERGITLGKEETIQLKPKHCLSIFVSGCYCREGYAERQGVCVKPEKCSNDPIFVAYLHRVHVY